MEKLRRETWVVPAILAVILLVAIVSSQLGFTWGKVTTGAFSPVGQVLPFCWAALAAWGWWLWGRGRSRPVLFLTLGLTAEAAAFSWMRLTVPGHPSLMPLVAVVSALGQAILWAGVIAAVAALAGAIRPGVLAALIGLAALSFLASLSLEWFFLHRPEAGALMERLRILFHGPAWLSFLFWAFLTAVAWTGARSRGSRPLAWLAGYAAASGLQIALLELSAQMNGAGYVVVSSLFQLINLGLLGGALRSAAREHAERQQG